VQKGRSGVVVGGGVTDTGIRTETKRSLRGIKWKEFTIKSKIKNKQKQ
jgi:hypothetical protein